MNAQPQSGSMHFDFYDFDVVAIGCGLAGYTEAQIKPMFDKAPRNCHLPSGWR